MKNNKGITLIVVIITVIVLLIIAGVSIGIINQNEIFSKAENAVDRASEQEQTGQEVIEDSIDDFESFPGRKVKSPTENI